MQFGYKEGHSTTLCTLVFKEVISNYINNGSCVYACLPDASKAFDRVHYGEFFNILLSKDIPKCIARLIFELFKAKDMCNLELSETRFL